MRNRASPQPPPATSAEPAAFGRRPPELRPPRCARDPKILLCTRTHTNSGKVATVRFQKLPPVRLHPTLPPAQLLSGPPLGHLCQCSVVYNAVLFSVLCRLNRFCEVLVLLCVCSGMQFPYGGCLLVRIPVPGELIRRRCSTCVL